MQKKLKRIQQHKIFYLFYYYLQHKLDYYEYLDEINKDEDLNKTTNITKPQNNTTIHKTLNTSTIKKSILKIYKDKLNNPKKNKTIRFKTEENNEKK